MSWYFERKIVDISSFGKICHLAQNLVMVKHRLVIKQGEKIPNSKDSKAKPGWPCILCRLYSYDLFPLLSFNHSHLILFILQAPKSLPSLSSLAAPQRPEFSWGRPIAKCSAPCNWAESGIAVLSASVDTSFTVEWFPPLSSLQLV